MARKFSEAMSEGTNVDPSIVQACLAEYTTIDSEMKRLAQKQAAMFTRYEGQGVNKKAVKNAHRLSRQDRAAAQSQAKTDVRYLVIAGILNPASDDWVRSVTQSTMFSEDEQEREIGVVSPQLAKARAYSDGYNTGRHGGTAENNSHTAGTEEFVNWQKGLTDGQADAAVRAKSAGKSTSKTTTADAEPRKRGRPRKAAAAANGAEAHG